MRSKIEEFSSEEAMLLSEGDYTFTAVFGNTGVFMNEEEGPKKTAILLKDISESNEGFTIAKEWFYTKALITLGKKNPGKSVRFNAHCSRFLVKRSGKLKIYCDWKAVTDISLI